MKTDNSNFIRSCFETLVIAVIIGLLTVWAVKAENNFDFDVINGLFTPTQSDKFFQAGREDFEREVEIFNHPEGYLSDGLLKIDPETIEQIDRGRQLPEFSLGNAQLQLLLDAKKRL